MLAFPGTGIINAQTEGAEGQSAARVTSPLNLKSRISAQLCPSRTVKPLVSEPPTHSPPHRDPTRVVVASYGSVIWGGRGALPGLWNKTNTTRPRWPA